VHFKNITVNGEVFPPSQIHGFNEKHIVKNVTIENFVVHGKKINNVSDGKISVRHAEGIQFK